MSVEPPWGKRSRTARRRSTTRRPSAPRVLYTTRGSAPVFHAGVGEEVLVLGRQDGVAEDGRHLVVGHDTAILPRDLDQHLAAGVEDSPGRRDLEADEGLEIRQTPPVEVDVVHEPHDREQEQQREARRRKGEGMARGR